MIPVDEGGYSDSCRSGKLITNDWCIQTMGIVYIYDSYYFPSIFIILMCLEIGVLILN